jgi:flagellin-like protein
MGMKGISPVIATVILIALSVAVGVMVSSWVMQWMNREMSGVSSCSSYSTYRIDSAKYTSSDTNLTIKITNMGKLGLYGFSVQIMNATAVVLYNSTSSDLTSSPNITASSPLGEQRTALIIVNLDGTDGNYSLAGATAEEIKVMNEACPASVGKIVKNDIVKE